MALTRRPVGEQGRDALRARRNPWWQARSQERILMLVVSTAIGIGLLLIYRAQSYEFQQAQALLDSGQIVNLNALTEKQDLASYLKVFPEPEQRDTAAADIRRHIAETGRLPNVGSLATIRVADRRPLLSPEQFQQLKPSFVVRTPEDYSRTFLLHALLYLVGLYMVHSVWSIRRFQADQLLLPMIHLMTGIGLLLVIGMRHPLRDNALFAGFAQGVALGAVAMLLASLPNYSQSKLRRLSFVPLLASFLLSAVLIAFGSGPGTSDAKVNLQVGPFVTQPIEAIKILLVLFLAGYFARNWEFLRELREAASPLSRMFPRWHVPQLQYLVPVLASVGLALLLFFLQRDLGPAFVLAILFLALYSIARGRIFGFLVGVLIMIAGFCVGYWLQFPPTVASRIGMWLSPWDNTVRLGGGHLAHSLWAMSTGGLFGLGPGLGETALIPVVHTDLVLSAAGEEFGFLGLLAIFVLYALLIYRAITISLNAEGEYGFFLGLGLTLVTAFQTAFIACGILGLLPFSGVVSPFLSYGRTSMVANLFIFGILASLSRPNEAPSHHQVFGRPMRWLTRALALVLLAILSKAAYTQVLHADAILGAAALVRQADGVRRFEYNPRLKAAAQTLRRGRILDRNKVVLSASTLEELKPSQQVYGQLGVAMPTAESLERQRFYPFGPLTFHLLGDLNEKINWAARNTSFVERDSNTILQGYDDHARIVSIGDPQTGQVHRVIERDYRELIPLVRNRHWPSHPAVREILDRDRDVRLSIDIRLQARVAEILERTVREAGVQRGAAVVIEPQTGHLLASVTFPRPAADQQPKEAKNKEDKKTKTPDDTREDERDELLDRPRYGLYPPGSAFKLITSIAALRKGDELFRKAYSCIPLGDGRVGNWIRGRNRPVRDDILDQSAHGRVSMEWGLILSCNAYYAQLGTYDVGAQHLIETAELVGVRMAIPNTPEKLRPLLPMASYGQGQTTATPLEMASVAAAIANHGRWIQGQWVAHPPVETKTQQLLPPSLADKLAKAMRGVVTSGTGARLSAMPIPVAGKTGTAELADKPSHAWFVGFAPYGSAGKQLAFAVIIENGTYGGRVAAPAAGEIIAAAAQLGIIPGPATAPAAIPHR
ncbi:MAG: FtsW/RodA/SpoVE family cell cycle protein [Acidobacteriota bacterium]